VLAVETHNPAAVLVEEPSDNPAERPQRHPAIVRYELGPSAGSGLATQRVNGRGGARRSATASRRECANGEPAATTQQARHLGRHEGRGRSTLIQYAHPFGAWRRRVAVDGAWDREAL
jgi:hypothetical protein